MTDLSGRNIVITGGGAGIGRALCIAAARAGARVIVASHHDNGAETADLAGPSAEWIRCDVTQRDDVDAAFELAGDVHGVVHNATSRLSSVPAELADVTTGEWREHSDVSLLGVYHCATAALPRFPARGGGRFVVMTSPAGMEGTPMNPLYGVVKGALR